MRGIMLASTLLSGAAGAAGLGEINLHSRIGEELLAEIPLTGNARDINDAACFTLTPIPGADLPVITNARIRLVQNRNGTHLLLIGSKPLAEPVFSINLRAGCGIDLQRTYVLMPEAPLPGAMLVDNAPRLSAPPPAFTPPRPPAGKTNPPPSPGKQAKTGAPGKSPERRLATNSTPPRAQAIRESAPRATAATPSTGDRLVLSAAPVDFGTAENPPAAGNPSSELEQRVLRMETSLSTLNQEMDALHTSLTLSTEMLTAKHELQLAQSLQQPAITTSAPAPAAARKGSGNNWLQLLLSTLVGGLVAAGVAHFVSRRQTARAAR